MSYSSPVVFLDHGHPCLRNFNSTIPVDVVRVKSSVNCLFDPTFVPVRITISKLNLIAKRESAPKRRRSGYGRVL